MDTFKDILVQLDTPDNSDAALQTALLVARTFTGHLNVIHVHQEPSCVLPMPVVTSDMAGFVVNDVVTAEENAFAKVADKMRQVFEKFVEHHGIRPKTEPESGLDAVTAEFREIYGCGDEVLSWCSRVADLTVLPRPGTSAMADDAFVTLNATLMESGTAALVAPVGVPVSVGKKVAIAWDASEEASKAVTFAMPFLTRAEEVLILETAAPNEEWAGAEALARRLGWHNISSSVMRLPEFISVSAQGDELIKQTCGRFDLLIMGAYTQSYMRRWILGSTTKYMVENADIPLFMAH
ncbi:MAG: universal stress protein [Alphaproteobacteria bacterium]|jgi:nucleotide-binding universal stress UspA family protein